MGLDPKEIAITMLLVSIFFHYFSYSFTITAIDYSGYELAIDIVDLYASGIMLGEYDEHNISFNAGFYTEFTLNDSIIRFQWNDWAIFGDSISSQIRAPFFNWNQWIDFNWQDIGGKAIRNETIIDRWDSENNWTKIHALTGYVLFITDPQKEGNITRATQIDGELTLTLAQDMAWSESPNVASFMSWYAGLVTGSESWGLPDNFSIIVRIMTVLGIFSGVFLLSELRRIVI